MKIFYYVPPKNYQHTLCDRDLEAFRLSFDEPSTPTLEDVLERWLAHLRQQHKHMVTTNTDLLALLPASEALHLVVVCTKSGYTHICDIPQYAQRLNSGQTLDAIIAELPPYLLGQARDPMDA
jgi:hypothetical protein